MADLIADIAAVADELCNPIRTEERLQDRDGNKHVIGRRGRAPRRVWVATFPSLVGQLVLAKYPGGSYAVADEQEVGRVEPASQPPARIEAINRLLAIEAGTAMWCGKAGVLLRGNVASNIRALVGACTSLSSDAQSNLLADMRAWRAWAAVASGWETPPITPHTVTCPACGVKGTIRARLGQVTAYCTSCGAWWDETTVGILARHIADAAAAKPDPRVLRSKAVQARRDWEARRAALAGRPRPDLPYACRRCGQANCQVHVAAAS